MEDVIKSFLDFKSFDISTCYNLYYCESESEARCKHEDGSGDKDGSGYGNGSGSGNGYNCGYGYGYGAGAGNDTGMGSGSGYKKCDYKGNLFIKSFNGYTTYLIDNFLTIFYCVHRNYAKGAIINKDFTVTDCYIAKVDNSFAHGDSLRKAFTDAQQKAYRKKSIKERINDFVTSHTELDKPYGDLFEWHNILTGSCRFGRETWCKEHGYKPTDAITVRTFIKETINNYGSDVIKQLAQRYKVL